MCTNNYSNKERFDKVTAQIKWCSFLCLTEYIVYREKSTLKVQFESYLGHLLLSETPTGQILKHRLRVKAANHPLLPSPNLSLNSLQILCDTQYSTN